MKNTPVRSVRRRSGRPPRNKRLIAVLATLGVFGAIIAVNQVSNAGTRGRPSQTKACPTTAAPATTPPAADPSAEPDPTTDPTAAPSASSTDGPGTAAKPATNSYHDHGSIQHPGDGQQPGTLAERRRPGRGGDTNCTPSPGTSSSSAPGNPSALEPLADNCEGSQLQAHDGFQNGERCVSTEFGEVAAPEDNPSLLITSAPRSVRANQQFTIRVSTRNLVRDRFLPAGQGGYYKESSLLNEDGIVRGHFHTACRMLTSTRTAPDPAPVPAFFVATEDGEGGTTPDEVVVTVPGLAQRGQAQCAVWAGDGSHRVPMQARANQVPAFDVVRVTVR